MERARCRAAAGSASRRRARPDGCSGSSLVGATRSPGAGADAPRPAKAGMGEPAARVVPLPRAQGAGPSATRWPTPAPYMTTEVRVALIGYGLAGATFHAPTIAATPGLRLATIVTASPERRERARREHPAARVVDRVDAIFASPSEHDLVVVATPNATHVPLALAALAAGQAVVVDKPFAPSAEEAGRRRGRGAPARPVPQRVSPAALGQRYLDPAAPHRRGRAGRRVAVRVPDRALAPGAEGGLARERCARRRGGPPVRSRQPSRGPGAAPVRAGGARVRGARPAATRHRRGRRRVPGAHARLRRSLASLGERPGRAARPEPAGARDARRLREAPPRWPGGGAPRGGAAGSAGLGRGAPRALGTARHRRRGESLRSEPGAYPRYYAGVVASLRHGAPPPVDPEDAVAGLEIIAAAQRSAARRETVSLPAAR